MNEKPIWANEVLAAIDEARRKRQELEESNEFYEKLYKLVSV
jgi:hypothetical protein